MISKIRWNITFLITNNMVMGVKKKVVSGESKSMLYIKAVHFLS